MGLFSFFKKEKEKAPQAAQEKTSEKLDAVIREITEKTAQQSLFLKATRKKTTVFGSKLGGTPYLPAGFPYPHNTAPDSDGKPLRILAQINLSELAMPLPGWPTQGILQFYIAYEAKDCSFGLDFKDGTSQHSFRVIYHETVEPDETKLQAPPPLETLEDRYFPFTGEFALIMEPEMQPITTEDFRFNRMTNPIVHGSQSEKTQCVLSDDENDSLCDHFNTGGHRLGGYPLFTQWDPRDDKNAFGDYTILLLQIDSQWGDKTEEIMWGDAGIANFFITPAQLQARDFSKALYNWDCC